MRSLTLSVGLISAFVFVAVLSALGAEATPLSVSSVPQVIDTIAIGGSPTGVAVNEKTNRIYVTNYLSNTISVIDGATNTVIKTIDVIGEAPCAAAVNSATNKIYIANCNAGSPVTVIDGENNTFLTSIPVGLNTKGIAVNSVTNRVYVTTGGSYDLEVIDGSNNEVIQTVDQPDYGGASAVAVNETTNRVYVRMYNSVHVLDGSTNNFFAAVTGLASHTDARYLIDVNPVTNMVYALNDYFEGPLYVIDGDSNTLEETLPVPPTGSSLPSYPQAVSVNPATNHVFVSDYRGRASVLNGNTNEFFSEVITFDGDSYPADVGVNPETNRVYVANTSTTDGGVWVIGDDFSEFLEFPIDYSDSDFATVAGLYEIEGGVIKTRVDHQRTFGSYMAADGVTRPSFSADNCRTSEFNACYDQADAPDIAVARDTPILAAYHGKVVGLNSGCVEGERDCGSGFGNYVWLDHANCYRTRYSHLQSTSVSLDQEVSTGDEVGKAGNTGDSGGPHLDFQVRFDPECTRGVWTAGSLGVIVDPYGWNPFNPDQADPLTTNTGYLWRHPIVTASSIDSSGGTASNPNSHFALIVPSGGLSESVTIEVGSGQYPSYTSPGWLSLGAGFWFRILEWFTPVQSFLGTNQFNVPAQVQILYDESSVGHVDESTAIIHQWDDASSTWLPLNTALDTANHLATANTLTHGIFNLQAQTLCGDVSEPNDDWSNAFVLTDSFVGSFDSAIDADWYIITVEPGEQTAVTASGSAEVTLSSFKNGDVFLQSDPSILRLSVPSGGDAMQFWIQVERAAVQTGCVPEYVITQSDYNSVFLPVIAVSYDPITN